MFLSKKIKATHKCCLYIQELVRTSVLVLASCLGLFTALNAGALIIFFLSQISKYTGLGAAAFKSLKSTVERLVLFNDNFRHLFSLPPNTHKALQGPITWLVTKIL